MVEAFMVGCLYALALYGVGYCADAILQRLEKRREKRR